MTGGFDSFANARQAQSDAASNDIQSQLASLRGTGAMAKLSPQAKEKKLREACEGFESIFIQKMWQEMRKSVHQSTLLHGREEQFWQDMYDQELAKKMTSAGGIGLADMMYEQLSSHLTSASRATALTAQRERTFIPPQAPLLGTHLDTDSSIDLTPPSVSQTPSASLLANSLYEPVSEKNDETKNIAPLEEKPNAPLSSTPLKQAEKRPQKISGNQSVERALATMRENVENERRIEQMLPNQASVADVNYAMPNKRQQPVASGLDMVKAVRRQAGDQLGSRGVREPLLPQTEKARNSTMAAYQKRDMQHVKQPEQTVPVQSEQPKQFPYSFPRSQAEMQEEAARFAASGAQKNSIPTESFVQNPVVASTSVFEPMASVQPSQPSPERERKSRTPQSNDIKVLNTDRKANTFEPMTSAKNTQDSASFVQDSAPKNTESNFEPVSESVPRAGQKQMGYSGSLFAVPPLSPEDVRKKS